MLMIRPQPAFVIRRAASRESWNTARTLRLKIVSKVSSVVSANPPSATVPALLTSTSSRPANRPPKRPVELRDQRRRPFLGAEVRPGGFGPAAGLDVCPRTTDSASARAEP